MSESHDGIAAASGGAVNATQAGRLYALNGATGAARSVSDFGDQQYAWTGDHRRLFPDDFPDSNPYGVLVIRDAVTDRIRTFVADAGANTIAEVWPTADRIISYIPNETRRRFRDATPTCIARGPTACFTSAPSIWPLVRLYSGRSNVYEVTPNANYPNKPMLWASGLTSVTLRR